MRQGYPVKPPLLYSRITGSCRPCRTKEFDLLKKAEIEDSQSCWNRAAQDEPVFILLGRDPAMAPTIQFWADYRIEIGKNQPLDQEIMDARLLAEYVKYRPYRLSVPPAVSLPPLKPRTALIRKTTVFKIRAAEVSQKSGRFPIENCDIEINSSVLIIRWPYRSEVLIYPIHTITGIHIHRLREDAE